MLEAVGSVPTNKYAEGYPGKRYYGGCEVVDEIEQLAIDRAKELFGAEHANVQPHAGAQANMAAYFGLLTPGDTMLSLRLDHGGHLTHGLKVNFSGRLYTIVHYGVSRETNIVDYDEVLELAKEHRPKLIVCGGSAYPRTVDAAEFRKIADEVGALLMCDMAHFSGLVAAGLHPNPVEHCDVVTSTTHKTLAGPRAGFVLCRAEHAQAIDRARLPRDAGRAARARDRREGGLLPDRRRPRRSATTSTQVRANADALAEELIDGGLDVLTGGTDTHLLQLDLRATDWTGEGAEERLDEVKLTVNRNTVPFDERPPTVASGVRIGTPAATMRGFDEDDFREVATDHRRRARRRRRRRRAAPAARERALRRRGRSTPGFRGYYDVRTHDGEPVTEVTPPARPAQARAPARRRRRRPHMFRQLVNELTLLLTYEATKDLADRGGRDRDAARADARRSGSPGKKVAVCPILRAGHGHARRRALADPRRARRLHRPLPQRGDARAGRVLREAAGRRRRARRAPARPDARDRQLDARPPSPR